MATIQKHQSRGHTYWYIVESRRVNGKPRPIPLAYLGKAEDLLSRVTQEKDFELKSYSHGDTAALINIAIELDIINIINKHINSNINGKEKQRDNLTVGASILLAAIGRACHPTSKMGWYNWCKTTSLEYCLKLSLKKLDSQHFWDQMNEIQLKSISLIEQEIVKRMISIYKVKLDCLLLDTTNFFTFIDSTNNHCDLPRRGKNKQKRGDLRQIGLMLLVSRNNQFPLFHKTYRGNKNDTTVFKENFSSLVKRIKEIYDGLSDITLIFDKGNNSKDNFKILDNNKEISYVGSLVPSCFEGLINEANKNLKTELVDNKKVQVYRTKQNVWDTERLCCVFVSNQLKDGQIRGIFQNLDNKYKKLEEFQQQLENPKKRKSFNSKEVTTRLNGIIKGQFVDKILKYELIELKKDDYSFTYFIDFVSFNQLKNNILGRRILITNRYNWTNEEIILAYRGQSKVEYTFRCLKNPLHMAIRPQFHWTDHKIEVHILICLIGYLLAVSAYKKAQEKADYKGDINNFMEELRTIRLGCKIEKKEGNKGRLKVNYKIEKLTRAQERIASALGISNETLRPKI